MVSGDQPVKYVAFLMSTNINMLYKVMVRQESDHLLYISVIWGIKPEIDVTDNCDI